ncbi:MAG: hypothetical protein WCW36_03725 [Candidatus Paceibacterota bacterium]|jgi:hypothetical protein
MEKTPAEIFRNAPSIQVGATVFAPQEHDKAYHHGGCSRVVYGNGSAITPYRFRDAHSTSPHYGIVDLWIKFHAETADRDILIQVNGCILQLEAEGVKSPDGHFTKLS